jgi:hypothetical protein
MYPSMSKFSPCLTKVSPRRLGPTGGSGGASHVFPSTYAAGASPQNNGMFFAHFA